MDNQKPDFITIEQIGKKIKRHKWTFVFCVSLSLLLAYLYNRFATRVYTAPAIVSFEQYSENDVLNLGFSGPQVESSFISNRIRELKTLTFAADVYQALPDSVRQQFRLPKQTPPGFDAERFKISEISKGLSAGQTEKGSSILTIAFDSYNRELAMIVTNTAVDVLQRRNLVDRRQEFASLKEFIDQQVKVVESELKQSEEALQDFKRSNNIASLDDESREILTRITQAEVLYNQALADTKAKQRRQVVLAEKIEGEKQKIRESVPETSNPMIARLREELVRLEEESASLQVQGYAADHPYRQKVSTDIERVKQNLMDLTMGVIQDQNLKGMIDPLATLKTYLEESAAIEIDIQALLAQQKQLDTAINSYKSRLKSLSENDAALFGLLRDRELNNQIYVNLLKEREQARLREAAEIGSMRVIERAQSPLAPYLPRKKLNLIIGLLFGSLVGLTIIFVRDSFSDQLRGEEDVEKVLSLPVLASVHRVKSKWTVLLNGDGLKSDPFVNIYRDSFTYLWNCLQTSEEEKYRSVMITSARPGEGKSTIAANLALTAAKLGLRVLLVDGDLRRPSLDRLLEVPDASGISELVYGGNGKMLPAPRAKARPEAPMPHSPTLEEMRRVLYNDLAVPGLSFLSAGSLRGNSNLIWASTEFKQNLITLMREYEFVVIDAPPVIGIPDAVSIGSITAGTILCLASDQADKAVILRARKLLKQTKNELIGVVWNKVKPTDLYGGYEYRKYYHTRN